MGNEIKTSNVSGKLFLVISQKFEPNFFLLNDHHVTNKTRFVDEKQGGGVSNAIY